MTLAFHFCRTCNARDRVHIRNRCVVCGSFYMSVWQADETDADPSFDALADATDKGTYGP